MNIFVHVVRNLIFPPYKGRLTCCGQTLTILKDDDKHFGRLKRHADDELVEFRVCMESCVFAVPRSNENLDERLAEAHLTGDRCQAAGGRRGASLPARPSLHV